MAKKKETSVNPFVPAEEQPYPIPANWCWVRLSTLSSIISKGTTPTGGKDAYVDTGVNFVRVENLKDDGTISHENIAHISENAHIGFLKRSILQENDILISIAGTLGKTGIVRNIDLPLNTNQALAFVRIRFQEISKKYIQNAINSTIIQEILLSKTKVTSIPNLTLEIIDNCPIPLAPVSEQHRIVSRIESLFSKLDEAKEKAQAVVDGFELRKSAILHKAFTGELTKRWRKEHVVGMESWKMVPFSDCIQKMQNGLAKRSGNIGESYVVLRLANLTENGFDTRDLREILLDKKEQESYSLMENDVVMVRVNGSKDIVGRQLLVPKIEKWAFCDHIIRICYQNNILPDYMIMFSKSDSYRAYVKDHMVSSAGQNTISRKGMANMAVPIPEKDEQREIVRLLSIIFSKERQGKEAAEAVIFKIETMKKAILARAFRGELWTNDPAEEWAEELVKKLLNEEI